MPRQDLDFTRAGGIELIDEILRGADFVVMGQGPKQGQEERRMYPGRNTNLPHPTSFHHILELAEAGRTGREDEPTDCEPRLVDREAQTIISQFGLKISKIGFVSFARLGCHPHEVHQVRQFGHHGRRCAHIAPRFAGRIVIKIPVARRSGNAPPTRAQHPRPAMRHWRAGAVGPGAPAPEGVAPVRRHRRAPAKSPHP